MLQIEASLTDSSRGFNYDCNIFITLVTVLSTPGYRHCQKSDIGLVVFKEYFLTPWQKWLSCISKLITKLNVDVVGTC